MGRVALRGLWANRRRLLSSVLAIVLGVGFMAGTFILATTLDAAADDLFHDSAVNVDAQVEGEVLGGVAVAGTQRSPLAADVVDRVREVEGVAAAAPFVATRAIGGTNRVIAADGSVLGARFGPATVFESWIDEPELAPYRLVEGRAPAAPDEIVLDEAAARRAMASVGEPVTVLSQFGREPFTLVGTFRAGRTDTTRTSVTVGMSLAGVQRLAGIDVRIDSVYVAAEGGVTDEELVARLAAEVDGAHVIDGDAARERLQSSGSSDLRFFQIILSVFGVVALLVGTFVISNTFTILVTQRTRGLALLRALGASRAQVFGSVLLEAAIVGVLSSAVGLAVGSRLALLINTGLRAIGAEMPTESLVVDRHTVVVSFVVGVAATLVAAALPAFHATRVHPLAAIREVAADRPRPPARRVLGGLVLLVLGTWLCSSAWRSEGAASSIPVTGAGAVVVVVAAILLGPLVAGPVVAAPHALLRRTRGLVGHLASENASRNPRRTSATASTVLISVALVVFVAAFAASAVHSVEADARRGFAGDFVVTGPGGLTLPNGMLSSPIAPTVREAVAAVPGVELVVGMGFASSLLVFPDGGTATPFVSSVDREGLGSVLLPRMSEGDARDLDDDGIFVDRLIARAHGLRIGDTVRYGVEGSRQVALRVAGISDDPNLLGDATVTRDRYATVAPEVRDVQVAGTVAAGADPAQVLAGVQAAIAGTPMVWAVDREAFVADLKHQIGGFTNVLYGLLVLSAFISVLGVANALSLTIHERTRELGLLRALGMDRSGVRSVVRWEAGLVGVFGTIAGLVVGGAVSLAVVTSLRALGLVTFALPGSTLALVGLGALLLSIGSALRPAHRAARVSILDAIGAE